MSELVCENLVTKAEFQELRDQLNEALGTKDDGSKVELFKKGQGTVGIAAVIGATVIGGLQTNAPSLVKEIVFDNPGFEPIWRDLANGKAKWARVNYRNERVPLPDLSKFSKTVGQNAKVSQIAAKGAAANGASLAVLANLVSIGATLALNIATVKVFDQRVDAIEKGQQIQLDAMNQSMLNLYEKNQGDIAKVNQEIEESNLKIAENIQTNIAIQSEVREANRSNAKLNTELKNANEVISSLQSDYNSLVNEVNEVDIEVQEVKEAFDIQISSIQDNLDRAQNIVAQQQQTVVKQETRIVELEERQEKLETQYESLSLGYVHLRDDFTKLKVALGLEEPTSLLDPDSEVARTVHYIKSPQEAVAGGGGGASPASVKADVDQQNGLLALAQNLSSADTDVPEITEDDVRFATTTFATTFDALISDFETGNMTPDQLEDLKNGIVTGTATNLNTLFADSFIPRLDDINSKVDDRRQINNTKAGICESLNGGSCPTTPSNPNPTQGLQGMNDNITDQGGTINALLGLADLKQGENITKIVKDTNQVINHKDFGLEEVQKFAQIAWETTRADKVLAVVNTAYTIHNAAMLSNSVLDSMIEISESALGAMGVKDHTGNPIDVDGFIAQKFQGIIQSAIGTEKYAELTSKLASYNRIYQSGANILYSVRNLVDSTQDLAETTGENIAFIGNALIKSGVVRENSYSFMPTEMSFSNRLINKLENVDDALDSVQEVISDVKDISEEIHEINLNKQEFEKSLSAAFEDKSQEELELKDEALNTPTPEETDEDKAAVDD